MFMESVFPGSPNIKKLQNLNGSLSGDHTLAGEVPDSWNRTSGLFRTVWFSRAFPRGQFTIRSSR
jgi:hypothetical protein